MRGAGLRARYPLKLNPSGVFKNAIHVLSHKFQILKNFQFTQNPVCLGAPQNIALSAQWNWQKGFYTVHYTSIKVFKSHKPINKTQSNSFKLHEHWLRNGKPETKPSFMGH